MTPHPPHQPHRPRPRARPAETAAEPASAEDTAPGADLGHRDSAARPLPPPGREPRAVPATALPFVLIGVLLFLTGALCVRELLIYHGLLGGAPWVAPTFQWIAMLTWGHWVRYVSPILVVIGLLGFGAALRPRRRTHLRLQADVPVWLSPTSVARACSARAEQIVYVRRAETTASRSRVRITVTLPDTQAGDVSAATPGADGAQDAPPADAASASTAAGGSIPDDRTIHGTVIDAVEPLARQLVPRPAVRVRIVRVAPTRGTAGTRRVR